MSPSPLALIVGAGPGLGLAVARRFGRAGLGVVLISRSAERHPRYLAELAAAGITAHAYAADVTDPAGFGAALAAARGHGEVELLYYGPAPSHLPVPLTETDGAVARTAFDWVWPAADAVAAVLPGMRERRSGALLFAGGLSSVRPMPMLGQLALPAAAVRNYALTLHAALAGDGVYAGTLTIGGVVERGDIHTMVAADPGTFGPLAGHTLDPDELAETAWRMTRERDRAETVFDVFSAA